MNIVNTLIPVFCIIALGAVLRKMRFMSADFVRGLNKLTYWVGLACLLFYTIADVSYNYQVAGKTFLVVFIGTLVCVAAGYVFAFLLRLARHR